MLRGSRATSPMLSGVQFLDQLKEEHALIDAALGSFRTWADRCAAGAADPADGARFLSFFQLWAGHHHHDREERLLFPVLVRELELPADRGPIHVLTGDHQRLGGVLDQLAPLLRNPSDPAAVQALAIAYSRGLWLHIDAENSVLLPEAEQRLVRSGIHQLPDRQPSAEELAARDGGAALVERYPQLEDLTIIRGEGCVICPAYGSSCAGVEKEWWNQSEWDELPYRIG